MKTLLCIAAACFLLVLRLPADADAYFEMAGEMQRYADRHAAASPRPDIHEVYRLAMKYAEDTRNEGKITDAQLAETREEFWRYLQRKYNTLVPRLRIPSEAEVLANQQLKAIEEQAQRLEAIERAIRDAEWQRSIDAQHRAMQEHTRWGR